MEPKLFAIVHWEDKLSSIIKMEDIKDPRKPIDQYREGEYVTAMYKKTLFKARLCQISENKTALLATRKNDEFPIKYRYHSDGSDDDNYESSSENPSDSEDQPEQYDRKKECKSSSNTQQLQVQESKLFPDSQKLQVTKSKPQSDRNISKSRPDTHQLQVTESKPPSHRNVSEAKSRPDTHQLQVTLSKNSPERIISESLADVQQLKVTESKSAQYSCQALNEDVIKIESGNESADKDEMDKSLCTSPVPSSAEKKSSYRKLEKRVSELERDQRKIKKKIKELEDGAPMQGTSLSSEEKTVDNLLTKVKHISGMDDKNVNYIIRTLSYEVFNQEEMITCTRTGKKTAKARDGARPAFEKQKMNVLEKAVLSKCPTLEIDTFRRKFDNLLKMQRRAEMKK